MEENFSETTDSNNCSNLDDESLPNSKESWYDDIGDGGSNSTPHLGNRINLNTFSITMNENKNNTNKSGFWKYNEDKTLKVAEEYIISTYKGHYTSDNSKVQILDIIESIGDGVPFCRDNLIKYSSRFGKKDGLSKLDALKIIHYGILLYNFAGFNNDKTDNYETFS